MTSAATLPHRPIDEAHRRTTKVQQDLQVASAELGLAWAIDQNAAVEQKVHDAAQELGEVKELLKEERAERARLQEKLGDAGD